MLKITEQRGSESDSLSLILEGRLFGPWVEELSACYQRQSVRPGRCVMIDLTGVTFIDAQGKALLAHLWREGAELRASGCLTRCVVEEITGAGRVDQSCKHREDGAVKAAPDEI
jgi:ABC-type transporter Mla MlaB component